MVGLVVGWVLLWLFGRAFVFEGPTAIEGYGWPGYVNNAWMVVTGVDVGYDSFRFPLHGWMLGTAGEAMDSYAAGGVLVASVCMVLVVAAAGVAGRALSGPWAGGLAAALVPLVPHNSDAARWANNYPSQAAFGGAAVALALACARWPRAGLALLGGVVGGIAWGIDGRAGLMALSAAALVLLAVVERPKASTIALPLLFAVGLAIGPWSVWELNVSSDPLPTLVQKVEFQRRVALRWSRQANDDEMEDACADERAKELPSIAGLQRPCAREMLRYNREYVMPRHLPLGGPVTLVLAALVLLPGRQGWRGSLRGAGWLAVAGAPLVAEMLWVPLPDRYVVPRAVLLAVLAPAGLGRLVATFGRAGAAMMGPAAVGVFVWAWVEDPAQRGRHTALQESRLGAGRSQITADVLQALTERPAPFLDCSEHFISTALLPRLTSPWPPHLRMHDASRCAAWLEIAEPGALVAVDPSRQVRMLRNRANPRQVRLEPSWLQAEGWEPVVQRETVQLWRRTGSLE